MSGEQIPQGGNLGGEQTNRKEERKLSCPLRQIFVSCFLLNSLNYSLDSKISSARLRWRLMSLGRRGDSGRLYVFG